MYKVLIADDELRVINVIKILLERQFPSCFSYIKAENGEAALEAFEAELPQLTFIDIRMPGINGIEVIKRIRKQSKTVYIVVITAYNYFEFAKDAIQAGVNDFILKPPSRENINEAINKFFEYIKEFGLNKKTQIDVHNEMKKLVQIIKTNFYTSSDINAFADNNTDCDKQKSTQVNFKKEYYVKQLVKLIRLNKHEEATETVYEAFFNLKNNYSDNSSVLKLRIVNLLLEVTRNCISAYENSIFINSMSNLLEFEEEDEFLKFLESFIRNLINKMEELKSEKRHFIVDKIIQYIDENYNLQLTVEDLSTKFSLSEFYFSRLFKEYKDVSFVDYLTEVRIKKAIEIMQNDNISIKEVSYMVGYNDPNYFSRVFKKVTGLSPSEYRNKRI